MATHTQRDTESFLGTTRLWTPAADALLGTAYDHEVGAKLGLSYAAVRQRRVKLGVPAHVPKAKTRRPR